ncbi:DUF3231 family protein [Desulfoscipio gibsoniae]|uniref:DUF3231 family protein n=1 Tax=Desulfoscipio gibsoniae DSM 7213 TaxID=767817 RepID=R4KSC3_9FIRM|nr:DUF3231 family protein [Desulfoscipio gibsoniae]AGL03490.1 Protein of unknown function (DUF3231) [Desulfoscipio gibsoniae DSM 7213]
MKLLEKLEQIGDLGQSKRDLQTELNVFEAGHLWNLLTSRYDVIEVTQVLRNFANDPDLKLVLNQGLKTLKQQVTELEDFISQYGLPLPKRPPASSESTIKVEVITDEYIYRRVLSGIQSFIPVHGLAMVQTTSAKLRQRFLTFLIKELKMYDKFLVYGQLKGWVMEPPAYRV